jgi:cytochrome c2
VSIFSSGHRNPQGLALASNGGIWETEHGPRGGDELNLLRQDGNYGWPWRSMGTEYALRTWPMQRPRSDSLTEPSLSFVPSKGLSNLIEANAVAFPLWEGSLLVGTLRARALLRVQMDGARPVYVEEIPLGFEVRDIEQARDGSLVVWTDQGAMLTIRPSVAESEGAALALSCSGCHTLNQGQRGALGPNLFGVVGRRVGTAAGFNYSSGMRALGGRWTAERLDAFLADPAGYAPGTSMAFAGIADSARRRQLVEYLSRVDSRR